MTSASAKAETSSHWQRNSTILYRRIAQTLQIVCQLDLLYILDCHITYGFEVDEETDASFKVNTELEKWYDFGIGKGGNILALAAELYHILLPCSESRWQNMVCRHS